MGLFSVGWLSAQDPKTDEERIVRRAKEEVIKELREGDFLQKQIEVGIERFVRKQQQTRSRAPDERAGKNVRPVSVERDHIFGNPEAEISLIEYSDFECPYCKRFHPTAKEIVKSYAGRVNWVYRHFPLDFHNPVAQKKAEASECAAELGGNDAFWKYSDRLYQRTRSNIKGFPITKLTPLAVEIGLDEKQFQACLDSGRHAARIQEDIDNGTRSGISGTPGNILLNNNTGAARLKPGALPFQELKAEIDRLLED
jgi:protein-disulfide isomerase